MTDTGLGRRACEGAAREWGGEPASEASCIAADASCGTRHGISEHVRGRVHQEHDPRGAPRRAGVRGELVREGAFVFMFRVSRSTSVSVFFCSGSGSVSVSVSEVSARTVGWSRVRKRVVVLGVLNALCGLRRRDGRIRIHTQEVGRRTRRSVPRVNWEARSVRGCGLVVPPAALGPCAVGSVLSSPPPTAWRRVESRGLMERKHRTRFIQTT